MSKEDKTKKRLSNNLPTRANYRIGYGTPPKESRFQPGQSGNPRGRPRGAKNKRPALNEERLKDIILDEAYRTINVREGEANVTLPVAQAVVRSIAVKAAKGEYRAQLLFTEMLTTTEIANKRLHDEWLETAIIYKTHWEHEIDRCKQQRLEPPDPVPHPDHIEIDIMTGEVLIKGPFTPEERDRLNLLREKKSELETEIAVMRQELIDDPEHEHRKLIEDDIADLEERVDILRRVVPD